MAGKKISVPATQAGIGQALDFLDETLTAMGLNQKRLHRAMLSAEEICVRMMETALEREGCIHLSVSSLMGKLQVRITADGFAFNLPEANRDISGVEELDSPQEAEEAIRTVMLDSLREEIRLKNHGGVNTAVLNLPKSDQDQPLAAWFWV